jgi:hypothetical protein
MGSKKAAKTLEPIKGGIGSQHCQQKEQLRLRLLSTVTMGKGSSHVSMLSEFSRSRSNRVFGNDVPVEVFFTRTPMPVAGKLSIEGCKTTSDTAQMSR